MEEPPTDWPGILALPSLAMFATGFFFDSAYSPKEPRSGTFFLLRPPGTGLLADLSRWMVLPAFSIDQSIVGGLDEMKGTYDSGTAFP